MDQFLAVLGQIWDTIVVLADRNFLFSSLVVLAVLDIISGIWAAVVTKTVSSKVAFPGMLLKAGYFIVILAVRILENTAERLSGLDTKVTETVIFAFMVYEGMSVLENATRAKLPMPVGIKEVFALFQGTNFGKIAKIIEGLKDNGTGLISPDPTIVVDNGIQKTVITTSDSVSQADVIKEAGKVNLPTITQNTDTIP